MIDTFTALYRLDAALTSISKKELIASYEVFRLTNEIKALKHPQEELLLKSLEYIFDLPSVVKKFVRACLTNTLYLEKCKNYHVKGYCRYNPFCIYRHDQQLLPPPGFEDFVPYQIRTEEEARVEYDIMFREGRIKECRQLLKLIYHFRTKLAHKKTCRTFLACGSCPFGHRCLFLHRMVEEDEEEVLYSSSPLSSFRMIMEREEKDEFFATPSTSSSSSFSYNCSLPLFPHVYSNCEETI